MYYKHNNWIWCEIRTDEYPAWLNTDHIVYINYMIYYNLITTLLYLFCTLNKIMINMVTFDTYIETKHKNDQFSYISTWPSSLNPIQNESQS